MRPMPPAAIFDEDIWNGIYLPDLELWQWCIDNLLNEDSPLFNPDHMHLANARIGFLWTNDQNASKGRRVVGQAEQPIFRAGKWQKGRQEQQMREWFGDIPDFVITLDANYCLECSDVEFLALLEHELLHCGQAMDDFGEPKFNRDTGEPVFALRDHDVQEFISVVRRYGVVSQSVSDMVEAAKSAPQISQLNISKMCGACIRQ